VELPAVTRRVLLRRSLHAAGALAVLPGFALACAPADAVRAPSDLRVLDAAQWAVLDAVADTFVPRGGAFPLGARDVELARRIDAFLAGEPPALVGGLGAALVAVEWAAPVAAGRFGRFSRLDADARTAAIDALCRSRVGLLRDVYAGLKQLCCFTFYALDASWAAIGYDGPWVRPRGTA
jgi:Gluconate 2-dehydrogenase subunit 3